ncbi:MAG: hypothetical protein AB1610_02000, partial [Nitrospirota bacterium]
SSQAQQLMSIIEYFKISTEAMEEYKKRSVEEKKDKHKIKIAHVLKEKVKDEGGEAKEAVSAKKEKKAAGVLLDLKGNDNADKDDGDFTRF